MILNPQTYVPKIIHTVFMLSNEMYLHNEISRMYTIIAINIDSVLLKTNILNNKVDFNDTSYLYIYFFIIYPLAHKISTVS